MPDPIRDPDPDETREWRDTFCLVDSDSALSCVGLFRHVRRAKRRKGRGAERTESPRIFFPSGRAMIFPTRPRRDRIPP